MRQAGSQSVSQSISRSVGQSDRLLFGEFVTHSASQSNLLSVYVSVGRHFVVGRSVSQSITYVF